MSIDACWTPLPWSPIRQLSEDLPSFGMLTKYIPQFRHLVNVSW